MNSRRRVTAALVVLLVLVLATWLIQHLSGDPPVEPIPLSRATEVSTGSTALLSRDIGAVARQDRP